MELEVRGIRKSFDGREILHGISFHVEGGRAMGFLGRNGAGKSTTFRCLMQVFRQDEGEFLLDGEPLDPIRRKIGYLPEERGMYSKISLRDQLTYFARLKGEEKKAAKSDAEKWIRYFDLEEFGDKKLETLSKGNQQKIQIAQALLGSPDVIILDEPFSGLDPVNAQTLKRAIEEIVAEGRLVIFSSHQMAYVEEMCDDITLIDKGTILLSGNLEKIKEQEGKNRAEIVCLPGAEEEIRGALEEAGLIYERKNERFLIDQREERGREALPAVVAEHFRGILTAGRYRPSLQEIFIEKAGESRA